MRYIEERGSGLRRVNRILAEYGIRPVVLDEGAFATQMNICRNSAITLRQEDGEGNREGNEGNEGNQEEHVFKAIKDNPKITIVALEKKLSISRATVERAQKDIQSAGRIRRKGGT